MSCDVINRSPPLLVKWHMTNRPVQGQMCVDIFDGVHASGMVVWVDGYLFPISSDQGVYKNETLLKRGKGMLLVKTLQSCL